MVNKAARKTDRRSIYTKMVVKDALLELLHKQRFEKITVTSVCKQAEITRVTFYLHFDHLTAVLDEILDEALKITETDLSHSYEGILNGLSLIADNQRDPEKLREYDVLLPVCQRIADSPKYRVLFLDETLSDYIIKKIVQSEKEKMAPLLAQHCHLSLKEAEMVFLFAIHGSYAVNKKYQWKKNEEWYGMQSTLARFILGGIDALQRKRVAKE